MMADKVTAAEEKRYSYTHRVGAITAGLCMTGFGILFLLNTCWGRIGYEMIFSLWPLILICLGLELFLSSFIRRKFVYDKAAIFLLIIMTFFAMTLAFVDVGMEYCMSEYL